MSESLTCAECHSPLPPNAVEGCPRCLLNLALDETKPDHRGAAGSPAAPLRFIGEYEVLEQIGAGGMGVVFKARHRMLNRIDALKMIRSGSLASAGELLRFRNEAQAAARLQHPNVIAIHQVGEEAGQVFFSMDYIEGKSLAEIIQSKPLSPVRAAAYVKTIADAVQYAHERGILHRDLKPANILIDAQDQPRITDFGLARQVEVDSDLSRSGDALGTPGYMPPEQAAGRRNQIGPASDVYSLGAVLYDLLTGRPPFRAENAVETLRQVLKTEPAPPRVLNRSVPPDLDTICLKCLSKDPARRYGSAKELAEELGRFLKHEPIKARPIGPAERTFRWCSRHPALAGIVALMILVSISAVAVARVLEIQLREQFLKVNAYAARGIAGTLLFKLSQLSGPLLINAKSEQLGRALKAKDYPSLSNIVQGFYKRSQSASNYIYDSWYVLDRAGTLRGLAAKTNANIIGQDFSYRDYFGGGRSAGTNEIYLSRIFLSSNNLIYKCAISTPIFAETNFVGILAATTPLGNSLGQDLNDPQRKAVLIGPLEVSWPSGATAAPPIRNYSIFAHEAIPKDTATNFPIASEQLRALAVERKSGSIFQLPAAPAAEQSVNAAYEDPMGRINPKYAGRWLAGFAPVGNTEWVVCVQQRYADSIHPVKETLLRVGLWGGSAVALLLLVIFGNAWLTLHSKVRPTALPQTKE